MQEQQKNDNVGIVENDNGGIVEKNDNVGI